LWNLLNRYKMRSEITSKLERFTEHLKRGDIVIFPTDTIYAVGCKISAASSIEKLYQLRKRPSSQPMLILASNLKQAKAYGRINLAQEKLLKTFWPGPLTAVLKAKDGVPTIIQGKEATVAIRVPNFPKLAKLIGIVGEPLVAPSANFHGRATPAHFNQIDKRLISLVDYTLDLNDFDQKTKMLGVASTIIDMTSDSYKILRQGAVSKVELENKIAQVQVVRRGLVD